MKKLVVLLIAFLVIVISQNSEAQMQKDTLATYLKKAEALAKQGKPEDASKIYTGIMASVPDNKDAVQGWILTNMKRTQTGEEEMIKSLSELSEIYPKNTGVIFFKAFIEAEYQHNDDALKDIDRLISLQPDTASHYILKGQVLSSMGKFNEAFVEFDQATTLDPKRSDVWNMKANALAKTGRFDEAIAAMNKGFELSPDNPEF
ncbi:MAG: tetratricopeptide repeat protein [Bacteroidales bacterium]|nr:tetratricopeptide repeat protein [Bacteroidales bacterium]